MYEFDPRIANDRVSPLRVNKTLNKLIPFMILHKLTTNGINTLPFVLSLSKDLIGASERDNRTGLLSDLRACARIGISIVGVIGRALFHVIDDEPMGLHPDLLEAPETHFQLLGGIPAFFDDQESGVR